MKTRYQILCNHRWIDVTRDIFRSWTGGRRKNGRPYTGPVYLYLTNTRSR